MAARDVRKQQNDTTSSLPIRQRQDKKCYRDPSLRQKKIKRKSHFFILSHFFFYLGLMDGTHKATATQSADVSPGLSMTANHKTDGSGTVPAASARHCSKQSLVGIHKAERSGAVFRRQKSPSIRDASADFAGCLV
ncbi:hypothetical protein ADH76_02175 [Enterocloster clostridioformis]|nr:hypothetical protein A4V08_02240 [Lachnoclostridium sp. YL32]OXE70287.1 hypothetical protein ADH76_02175 [Enterocloster clostridioformis]